MYKDLTGQRFGGRVVIKRHGSDKWGQSAWLTRCDCGNEAITSYTALRNGKKGCAACVAPEDLTGRRFGSRIVLGRQGTDRLRQALWSFRCDCGKEGTATTQTLKRTSRCKSCKINGFLAMPNGEAALNKLLHKYKQHAVERDLEWCLTKEEFRELTKQRCYYCGHVPDSVFGQKAPGLSGNNGYEDYIYNGVDRLDNDRGYFSDNSVPCCKMCNFAKRNVPVNNFEAWILRAANHIKNR